MKLGRKLTLSFACVLCLVVITSLSGIYFLNGALNTYSNIIKVDFAREQGIGNVLSCLDSIDHIPLSSYPLFKAREQMSKMLPIITTDNIKAQR
jgi:hypothetical protein